MTPPETAVKGEALNSWKEIARYLDRGVRTVQRWEVELALPVVRPRMKGRAVIAMRSEIDAWLQACPTGAGVVVTSDNGAFFIRGVGEPQGGGRAAGARPTDLILHSRLLRGNCHRLRKDFRVALDRFKNDLQKLKSEASVELPEDPKS